MFVCHPLNPNQRKKKAGNAEFDSPQSRLAYKGKSACNDLFPHCVHSDSFQLFVVKMIKADVAAAA